MKGPLAQLLLVTVLLGIGLWVGVKWFLGGTDELSANIDIRSVGYLRESDTGGATDAKPDAVASAPAVSSNPSEILERNSRIEAQQVTKEEAAEDASAEEESPIDEAPEDVPVDEKAADEEATVAELDENVIEDALSVSTADDESEQVGEGAAGDGTRKVTLSDEELQTREKARQARLAELGLIRKKAPEPTVAVDVSLEMPERCSGSAIARIPVGLKFRYESAVMRGESLNALQALVAMYRECDDGKFLIAENPLGRADATDTLKQMRFDEVKYFFIQHSVSIDTVQFPEE